MSMIAFVGGEKIDAIVEAEKSARGVEVIDGKYQPVFDLLEQMVLEKKITIQQAFTYCIGFGMGF